MTTGIVYTRSGLRDNRNRDVTSDTAALIYICTLSSQSPRSQVPSFRRRARRQSGPQGRPGRTVAIAHYAPTHATRNLVGARNLL